MLVSNLLLMKKVDNDSGLRKAKEVTQGSALKTV